MIILDNGHKVEAEFINYRFDVDGKRHGAGVVICFDRMDHFITDREVRLYVTWVVYPSRDNNDRWIAETGHYGLPWDEAIEDALKRFRYFDREFDGVGKDYYGAH